VTLGILLAGCGGRPAAPSAGNSSFVPELVLRTAECRHKKKQSPAEQANILFKGMMDDIRSTPGCAFNGRKPDVKRRNALDKIEQARKFYFRSQFKQASEDLSNHFTGEDRIAVCDNSTAILKVKIDFLIKFINHNGFDELTTTANPTELLPRGSAALTAILSYGDGFKENIVQHVAWAVSAPQVGSVAGATFNAGAPGGTQLTAALFTWLSSEPLTVFVKLPEVVQPPAPLVVTDLITPPAPPEPPAPPVVTEPLAPQDPPPPPTPPVVMDLTTAPAPTELPAQPVVTEPPAPQSVPPTPFHCGNVVSITPPVGWGIYPDSLVAFESTPGDRVNWGSPIIYVAYDYSGNFQNYLLGTAPNPTGCLIAEGNPGSMLTAAVVAVTMSQGCLDVYFPDLTTRAQNSNMAIYVASDGSTYWARSDNYTTTLTDSAPDQTYWQALTPEHLARKAP
jgi:hypothetical protein